MDSEALDVEIPELDVFREKFEKRGNNGIEQDMLPYWPSQYRALPNAICRSALFTARNMGKERLNIHNQLIFVVSGDVKIRYTGSELRASDDELVFLQILELSRNQKVNTWVKFDFKEICTACRWKFQTYYFDKIHDCLLRLKATALQIESQKLGKEIAVSLIRDYEWEVEDNKRVNTRLKISPGMDKLFMGNEFTRLKWREYCELSSLARRIYDWTCSHAEPFPIKLETIYLMCKSDTQSARKWRQQVKDAIHELKTKNLISDGKISKVNKIYYANFTR